MLSARTTMTSEIKEGTKEREKERARGRKGEKKRERTERQNILDQEKVG